LKAIRFVLQLKRFRVESVTIALVVEEFINVLSVAFETKHAPKSEDGMVVTDVNDVFVVMNSGPLIDGLVGDAVSLRDAITAKLSTVRTLVDYSKP
jgi:hypothetical protein